MVAPLTIPDAHLMSSTPKISLQAIRECVLPELASTDQLIQDQLFSDVPLIQTIVQHIIQSGGKRLRPLLVLLTARALNYSGAEHIELATVIEFIHTATLLHDDVVDESKLRRGKKTANAIWDNQASVLTGDFLYSRAFQLLAKRSNVPVTKLLAETTNTIAEGEILQLMNRDDTNVSEKDYRRVIHYKTAKLFEAAAGIGAMIATDDASLQKAAMDFGKHLGMAYQIIDDLLDYTASAETMGKNVGDDLAEGKITLPLICALERIDPQEAQRIKSALQTHDLSELTFIQKIISETQSIKYTQQCAAQEIELAKTALSQFPPSLYRTALQTLAEFVAQRNY